MFNSSSEIIRSFTSAVENKKTDFLKRENSNYVYSLPLLRHHLTNFAEEEFLLNEILPKELKDLYDQGIVYIHDKQLSPYCVSVGCRDIATFGIPTLAKNMLSSKPTKRLDTLLRHFSNVVVLMSQQVSGAVMLSQMTTVAASYLYFEEIETQKKYSQNDLKQLFQSLIWEMNMPLRSGSQSAFSNITMEFGKPSEEIKDEYIVIGGEARNMKYKEIPSEYFDRINQAIIDVMAEGTGNGIPFTFPLITVPIDDHFNFDNDLFLYLLDKMYNWGGVYFENFRTTPFDNDYYKKLNPYIKARDPEASRSLCCRLQIDLSLLSKVGSGIFGSSTGSTGAVQVLNLNANRLLMEFGHDKDLLKQKMREYLEIMQKGHQAKRKWIEANKELYPTFFAFNKDLKNYFNVFAITSMHEGLINIGFKDGIKDEQGKKLAHEIMQYMTEVINEFIVRDQVACGIEYAPAENAGIKLARHDMKWAKEHNREIFVQGKGEDVYLTSGCMLPFSEEDFSAQIENAAEFQAYATSGSILHHFLETKVEPNLLADYIDKLFQKPINYITLTPTITSCMTCGQQLLAEDGKNIGICPVCGSDDIATFSRVIGYVRMIARKKIKVDQEGFYNGEQNFWSKARRFDWNTRKRIKSEHLKELHHEDILTEVF
ncbi:anaerobic ribonucleoside-triphosphate reductase [Tepidibacillus fermentans]|uniref:Ribonucleoside-triphosphate reductase class III catalytic subunit n=1 Tax=Tepidibacillus fermentans TaxID=1281767 RepID=A0A4R3KB68_9BACI|nr:anaerobic ribonucleoside-triphosphate reductase [Tepidibacillus fermentans]TCS79911.1 ribonucleoside-triphosphate reductase class III catalytic subunit [Tepidibacillus fermentans]